MAMVRVGTFGFFLFAAVFAGGCTSAPKEQLPSLITDPVSGGGASADTYQLSRQELGYSCQKLKGVMQVRLLQVRKYEPSNDASSVARGMQSVATPIFGGTTVGIDPASQHRQDLAMLEAYNHRLAAKKCKTFDLAAELKKPATADMPAPTGSKTRP